MLLKALELLEFGKRNSYDAALGALQECVRKRWAEVTTSKRLELMSFDVDALYSADAPGLQGFLREEMMRNLGRRQELESSDLIQDQAFGEALEPDQLEGLARYEVHLDRKFERVMAMLLRLQDLHLVAAEQ